MLKSSAGKNWMDWQGRRMTYPNILVALIYWHSYQISCSKPCFQQDIINAAVLKKFRLEFIYVCVCMPQQSLSTWRVRFTFTRPQSFTVVLKPLLFFPRPINFVPNLFWFSYKVACENDTSHTTFRMAAIIRADQRPSKFLMRSFWNKVASRSLQWLTNKRLAIFERINNDLLPPVSQWPESIQMIFWKRPMSDNETARIVWFLIGKYNMKYIFTRQVILS